MLCKKNKIQKINSNNGWTSYLLSYFYCSKSVDLATTCSNSAKLSIPSSSKSDSACNFEDRFIGAYTCQIMYLFYWQSEIYRKVLYELSNFGRRQRFISQQTPNDFFNIVRPKHVISVEICAFRHKQIILSHTTLLAVKLNNICRPFD